MSVIVSELAGLSSAGGVASAVAGLDEDDVASSSSPHAASNSTDAAAVAMRIGALRIWTPWVGSLLSGRSGHHKTASAQHLKPCVNLCSLHCFLYDGHI
jgi:hypothetical protein